MLLLWEGPWDPITLVWAMFCLMALKLWSFVLPQFSLGRTWSIRDSCCIKLAALSWITGGLSIHLQLQVTLGYNYPFIWNSLVALIFFISRTTCNKFLGPEHRPFLAKPFTKKCLSLFSTYIRFICSLASCVNYFFPVHVSY